MSILIPSSEEVLFPYDRILVIGTEPQIHRFAEVMEVDGREVIQEEETNVAPNYYILDEKSYISNKSISGIDFRGSHCMVLGIERLVDGVQESYMNPSPDFIFRPGDVVWMIGETEACQWFVES